MTETAPRLLVADEDEVALADMARVLREAGFQVIEAASRQELVELLETRHFDAVITELHLRGGSVLAGLRTAQALGHMDPGWLSLPRPPSRKPCGPSSWGRVISGRSPSITTGC